MINTIQNCASSTDDAACYCTNALQLAMQDCEQCMLNFLVTKNIKQPSPMVGSNPALAGESSVQPPSQVIGNANDVMNRLAWCLHDGEHNPPSSRPDSRTQLGWSTGCRTQPGSYCRRCRHRGLDGNGGDVSSLQYLLILYQAIDENTDRTGTCRAVTQCEVIPT
jgi:hypothetical protein